MFLVRATKRAILARSVEGDETCSFSNRSKASDRACRVKRAERRQIGQARDFCQQIPVIVARDRHGATTDAVLPKLNRVSITAALGGIITSANEFCCDGGTCDRCLRPPGWYPNPHPANARQAQPVSAG